MASITFQYRSKKDFAPVEARFTFKRDGKHISLYTRTRKSVPQKFWLEYKEGINFRDETKANLKKEVDDLYSDLHQHIINEYQDTSQDQINKDWLTNTVHRFYNPPEQPEEIPTDLIAYWKYYMNIRGHELTDKMGSYRKWMTIFRKLKRFQMSTGKEYLVKDVNEQFKRDFVDYCRQNGYANSTITKDFAYIKTVCIHARTKSVEVSPELDTLRVELQKKSTPKIYLSPDEITAIVNVEGLTNYLDNARDWLIISCYTGQRVSDFMRFKKSMIRESQGRLYIDVKQVKTGKNVTIPLLPEVVRILDKRGGKFPRSISHQRYNEWIKDVCKAAGLDQMTKGGVMDGNRKIIGEYPKYELVTSHVGRRSFATNHYGMTPTSFLKNITGHSTEQQLLEYIGKSSDDTAPKAYDDIVNAK